jgi:hypothetical protein
MGSDNRKHCLNKYSENMSDNHTKPTIAQRIGEFLILTIFLVFDILEFWNRNHLITIFLAGIGILALGLLDGILLPQRPWRIISIVAFLTVLGALIDLIAPAIPPPEPWRGWLQPANEPTPENACSPLPGAKKRLTVLLGDSAFADTIETLAQTGGRFTPLSICGRPALFVEGDRAA